MRRAFQRDSKISLKLIKGADFKALTKADPTFKTFRNANVNANVLTQMGDRNGEFHYKF